MPQTKLLKAMCSLFVVSYKRSVYCNEDVLSVVDSCDYIAIQRLAVLPALCVQRVT